MSNAIQLVISYKIKNDNVKLMLRWLELIVIRKINNQLNPDMQKNFETV